MAIRRRAGIVGLTVVTLLSSVLVGTALGHRAYEGWTTVANQSGYCVQEKVSLDHVTGNIGGKFWTEGYSKRPLIGVGCSGDWYLPAGDWRTRVYVLKKQPNGTWATCADTGFHFSPDSANYQILTVYAGSTAPCGAGWYRTKGNAAVYWNGAWTGGALEIKIAEAHYLPCAQGATCP